MVRQLDHSLVNKLFKGSYTQLSLDWKNDEVYFKPGWNTFRT